jgi:hypothetical protein
MDDVGRAYASVILVLRGDDANESCLNEGTPVMHCVDMSSTDGFCTSSRLTRTEVYQ